MCSFIPHRTSVPWKIGPALKSNSSRAPSLRIARVRKSRSAIGRLDRSSTRSLIGQTDAIRCLGDPSALSKVALKTSCRLEISVRLCSRRATFSSPVNRTATGRMSDRSSGSSCCRNHRRSWENESGLVAPTGWRWIPPATGISLALRIRSANCLACSGFRWVFRSASILWSGDSVAEGCLLRDFPDSCSPICATFDRIHDLQLHLGREILELR
jgi:hypothetical protein